MLVLFSPQQREILIHRLEVSDALAEVAADSLPDTATDAEREAESDAVYHAAEWLREQLEDSGPRCLDLAANPLTPAHRFALADAINGSTYLACAISGGLSPQRVGQIYAAGCTLAARIQNITGYPCEYPNH